ncbi:MAG: hypothetical protein ACOX1U_04040 [Saccharofermentanales bacterium]
MKAYKKYLNNLISLIEQVRDSQDDKFESAAELIADVITRGAMPGSFLGARRAFLNFCRGCLI